MPRPMLFEATQRPQALSIIGVATQMDSCGLRMFSRPPPHPPTMENRPDWGQAGQKRGRAIAKDYDGGWRVRQKSVDWPVNRAAGRITLSKTPSRISQNLHGFTCFVHENTTFIHGLYFLFFLPRPSLYLSFTNEKERDREGKQAKLAIHGFLNCLKIHHRKKPKIFANPWIVDRSVGRPANPWAVNLYKSMGYSTSTENYPIHGKKLRLPRVLDGQHQGFTLASKVAIYCAFEVYNRLVTSKTGVIGFDSPRNHCDESRRTASDAAFSSCAPVLAARVGSRKARWFTQVVPGLSTRSSRRLCLTASATVDANRTTWRPNMATSAFSPDFVDLVTGIQNDARQTSLALTSIMQLLRGCDAEHQLSAGALQSLLEPIWGSLDTLCGDLKAMHVGEVTL